MTSSEIEIQSNVNLSEYTTIQSGGNAKFFIECKSETAIVEAVEFAKNNNLKLQPISGGSNILFQDEGYDGIVIKIDTKGIMFERSERNQFVKVNVKAGENWDDVVKKCIDENLTGLECLSGIPGSAGATPIQNVGAYGQEVSDSLVSIRAIDRKTLKTIEFSNEDCKFEYRQSRFKNTDKDKFIITEVTFSLIKNGEPELRYPELKKFIEANNNLFKNKTIKEKLNIIRDSVIQLRKKKSMVIDKNDPNTKSCGSFFLNPVLDEKQFEEFKKLHGTEFPFFDMNGSYKIPAAWLIENSGFSKGYKKNGAGISENHSLAIINCGGNTKAILELADEISSAVINKFAIHLEKEPVIIK